MSELYRLPEGWIFKKFDEIKISNTIGLVKNQQQQSIEYKYKYVKMNNITNENGFSFNNIINVEATDEEVDKFSLVKGDFLFNTRNSFELVGKTCIFDYDLDEIVLYNNNIMRVRFKDNISPYFIGYQFSSNFIQAQLNNIKSGTTNVSAIYYKTLKDIDVIIPPLQEQKRIVSKLDNLFEKIDKAIALHQKNMDEADAFMGSVLNDVFGELEERYEKVKISDIAQIKGGKRLPKGKKLSELETDYPYIRVADFLDIGTVNTNTIQYITEDIFQQIKNYTITSNDLYISIAGTIGKTGIIPKELDGANLTENAAKIVYKTKDISNKYIYFLTNSSKFAEQIGLATKIVAQPKLALSRLSEVELPLPPLPIQQKVVKYLDEISQKMEKVKTIQKEKMDSLKALKASILDQAFRGEL